jgi:hypothetical protein
VSLMPLLVIISIMVPGPMPGVIACCSLIMVVVPVWPHTGRAGTDTGTWRPSRQP